MDGAVDVGEQMAPADGGADACAPAAEPIALDETPPLPGDACADPPTPRSRAIEGGARTGQMDAAADVAELLDPTRITVVTCGTGNPVPSARAQSCTAIFVGGQFLLFDAGDGAQRAIEQQGLPITGLTAIFLTHFHSDHIADVGEAISRSWIQGRTTPLPVHGGPGVERIIDGFNLIYRSDDAYRVAHHGEEVFPTTPDASAVRIDDPGIDGQVVYDVGGVVVRAYRVDHAPVAPSYGYRVEYGDRSVGISGDTVDTAGLRALAADADLLVSEVLSREVTLDIACALERLDDARNSKIFRDVRTYHVDIEALGAIVAEAGVEQLVLTHVVPSLPEAQAQTVFGDPLAAATDAEVVLANDGDRFVLPVED